MKRALRMASVDEVERRTCNRVLLKIDIEVCLLPEDGAGAEFFVLSCKTRDVSGGGISFYGGLLYLKHSVLRLRIPLILNSSEAKQQESQVLNVMGKVIWSRKQDSSMGSYATGVKFLNIYEDDFAMLENYVKIMQNL